MNGRVKLCEGGANNLEFCRFNVDCPGGICAVQRPSFVTSKSPPPDANGDGISDNVMIFSENNASFLVGGAADVITPGKNGVRETNRAGDDAVQAVHTLVVGPNGVAESGLCGDDVMVVPKGTGGLTPDTPIITAGPNGILESNPSDVGIFDDVVGPDLGCPMKTICAGPNGVAQSGLGGDSGRRG